MRKKWPLFILILVLLTAAAAVAVEYVNRAVLPVKAKAWAEKTLSESMGRKATIRAIRIHLWRGIVIEGITVEEDSRYGTTPFLEIEQVSGKILYLPLLKNRRIILPSIQVIRPKIRLIQDPHGVWNVQSLALSGIRLPAKGKLQVLVPKVLFEESLLEIQLQKSDSPFKILFNKVDAEVHVSLPSEIVWSLSAGISPDSPSRLLMHGIYNMQTRNVSLECSSSFELKTVLPLLPEQIRRRVDKISGPASFELSASGPAKGPFSAKAKLVSKDLSWRAAMPEPIAWGEEELSSLEGRGGLSVTAAGRFPAENGHSVWEGWQGTADFNRMAVRPLPAVKELKELTGRVEFSLDGVRTEKVTALLPDGPLLTAAGGIQNNDKKSFSFRIETAAPLEQLIPLVPGEKTALLAFKPAGNAAVSISLEGTLYPALTVRPVALAALQNCSADIPSLGPLTGIAGLVRWQPDLVTISGLRGNYREKPFELEGTLVSFEHPEIEARLSWDTLAIDSRFQIEGERLEIEALDGRYGGGTFSVTGQVSGRKEMNANLYGETSFKAEEADSFFPSPPAWLKEKRFRGLVSSRWILEGPLLKPAEWNFGIKATSPFFEYRKLKLERLSLEVKGEPGEAASWSAKSECAGGTLTSEGRLYTGTLGQNWTGQLTGTNVELATLARDLQWGTKDISGKLSLEFDGGAKFSGLDTLSGKGNLRIDGGQIAELPLLGGFADLLKIPTLRTITLREAEGTFSVGNGRITTRNLELKAPPKMTLTTMGSCGFLSGAESPINLKILPTLSPDLIPEENRSKLGRVITQGTSYLIGEIRITGTWKEPKRRFIPKPIPQILNEQLLNLEELFKELF